MDAEKIIKAARKRLIRGHPFHACMSYQLKFTATASVPAMATDGRHIYYNRGWVEQQSIPQAEGVIAHEIMHVAGYHHLRKGSRDHALWNIACDYSINGILIKLGFKLPDDGLYDLKYEGRAAERIYAALLKERQEAADKADDKTADADGSGDSSGSDSSDDSDQSEAGNGAADESADSEDGTGPSTSPAGDGDGTDDDAGDASTPGDGQCIWGEVLDGVNDDGDILSKAEIAAEERKIASQIHQAVQAEKQANKGQGHGGGDGYLRDITESLKGEAQPWHQILREAMTDAIVVDQSYTNPDRRFIYQGLYLADDETIPNGSLAFVVDTSCSLTHADLGVVAKHAQDIIDDVNPIQVYIIYVDYILQHIDVFDRGDDVVFNMHGGGGTAFNPGFNWLAREGTVFKNRADGTEIESPGADAIDGLVYFTDGEASVGPDSHHGQDFEVPDYPVFWATTAEDPRFYGCQPFGEIIYVD